MKKYFIFVLISFLFFEMLLVNAKKPVINKIVVIDPGHGGLDPGTIYQDIYEKDINLILCKKLQESLIKNGAMVYLTRNTDKDLSISNTNRKRP